MGLVTFDPYEIVRFEFVPFVIQPDFAIPAEDDHAMLVLMPLERRVASRRHLVIADLERRQHVRAEDLLRNGHPPTGVVLVGLDVDTFPLTVSKSGDHGEECTLK